METDAYLRILQNRGFSEADAQLSSRLFTSASCDGVYSHGLNKFTQYIGNVDAGHIIVGARPELRARHGSFEQWDGCLGPGNLNAYRSMERAVNIARENGIGLVALANTNHWMRGGSYGWQAAEKQCMAILWTNTVGNMPPWGGVEPKLGNNPMVLALPRKNGHVVLDFAQSLYSYGKLGVYRSNNESLPSDGGFDSDGRLSRDAAEILTSKRPLPAGLWKGSGLSLLLDLFATVLSGGRSTMQVSRQDTEYGVSQVFFVVSVDAATNTTGSRDALVDEIIADLQASAPSETGQRVRYPGEQTLKTRHENMRLGIPVSEKVWKSVSALLPSGSNVE